MSTMTKQLGMFCLSFYFSCLFRWTNWQIDLAELDIIEPLENDLAFRLTTCFSFPMGFFFYEN